MVQFKLVARLAVAIVFSYCLCAAGAAIAQPASRDGAHDFDWEIGTWETQVRVRAPLSEAAAWTEFRGMSRVHGFADGQSNLVDLDVESGDRRIEGVSLRLYDPQARQWSLNFASMADGRLTSPVHGSFENGVGSFYGQDTVDGRVVLVRFVISDVRVDSARFVQSYSADGGQTWIDNWIAVDTRRR